MLSTTFIMVQKWPKVVEELRSAFKLSGKLLGSNLSRGSDTLVDGRMMENGESYFAGFGDKPHCAMSLRSS